MSSEAPSHLNQTVRWLFLLLLAIFPISNTIALRNLLLLALLGVSLILLAVKPAHFTYPLRHSLRQLSWPILFWTCLLLLFPLWARESTTAWQSLANDWLEALFAGFVGYAVWHLLGRKGPGLLALAYASAVPLLLHLLLCLAALLGWLNNAFFADPTIATLWDSLLHPEAFPGNPHWTVQGLMHGFRGLEPMHGNLGYPACQAIALFCAYMAYSWRARQLQVLWLAVLGIALCFLSILIAQSRGAILYAFLIMALALVLARMHNAPRACGPSSALATGLTWRGKLLGALAALVLLSVTFQYVKRDPRWFNMADSVEAAFAIENPTRTLCEGLDAGIQDSIRSKLADRDPQYVQAVIAGLQSDGGRILLLRAGLQLALENPWGLDGSRHSYQKLIREKCGHEPVMQYAHSHDSWIDLSLALGWLGVLAFASMMVYFLRCGLSGMRTNNHDVWSMALALISGFWILRGFADSVYREHYLQMQLIVLMYLLGGQQFPLTKQQPGQTAA